MYRNLYIRTISICYRFLVSWVTIKFTRNDSFPLFNQLIRFKPYLKKKKNNLVFSENIFFPLRMSFYDFKFIIFYRYIHNIFFFLRLFLLLDTTIQTVRFYEMTQKSLSLTSCWIVSIIIRKNNVTY